MSVCTFIASNSPLKRIKPENEDDNLFLLPFRYVSDYSDMKHGVYLEWDYTDARAEQVLNYIKEALKESGSVEFWHVWLGDYYEYEDSPVIHKRRTSINDVTIKDIKEINNADIWNKPDKQIPSRPSFYCMKIKREK